MSELPPLYGVAADDQPGRIGFTGSFGPQVHDHDGRIAGVAHTWMIIPQTITVPREIP